jgi:hypothetical protein
LLINRKTNIKIKFRGEMKMKVRIIKNAPEQDAKSIEEFIGRTYNAQPMVGTNNVSVDFGIKGTMTVYKNEYEVIDRAKEVEDFIAKYYPHGLCSEAIREFMLENRLALLKILS